MGREGGGGKVNSLGLLQNRNRYIRKYEGKGQKRKSSYCVVYRRCFRYDIPPARKMTANFIIISLLTSYSAMSLPGQSTQDPSQEIRQSSKQNVWRARW